MLSYTNAEVQAMYHVLFCTLSIMMNVLEENINALSTNVVLNLGYHLKNITHCF